MLTLFDRLVIICRYARDRIDQCVRAFVHLSRTKPQRIAATIL